MAWLGEVGHRLRSLVRRRELDDGLDEELRFHLERQIEKNLRAGMSPDEARRRAHIRLGGVEAVKERTRDQFRAVLLESSARDIRYALRSLRRSPSFTAAAVLTLALGIGATTAVFSVVHGVLLEPLAYPDPDRLIAIRHRAPGLEGTIGGSSDLQMSAGQYFTYADENRTLEAFGLWSMGNATITGLGEPEEVRSLAVTSGTLRALGVQPFLGRWFSPADEAPGSPEAIVLMHGYWQRRFGRDTSLVGRTIMVNARPRTIVGIMPDRFRFLSLEPDLIACMQMDRSGVTLGQFNYDAIGRLRTGVQLSDATADVTRMLGIWIDAWPAPSGYARRLFETARVTPDLRPLKQDVIGDIGNVLWVVLGTIGIVLLIACANVANLLLVRAEGRQSELAVRAALGAGRSRLARELLAESVTLGALGGVAGLGFAFTALNVLIALEPTGLPRLGDIAIDRTVLFFAATVSLLSGVLFGLAPVVRHAGPHVAQALRGGSRTASDSRQRHRTRNALVVAQIGLALVLLVASGLMIRTFLALRAVDPGFTDADRVQLVRVPIPPARVKEPLEVFRRQREIHERIRAVPGVSAVSFATAAPMEPFLSGHDPIFVEGRTYADSQVPPIRRFKFVAPGFFSTLGTRLFAGRDFTWTDLDQRRPVAVVSESMARQTWGQPERAIGERIRENANGVWREIVGIVADVHDEGLHQPVVPTVYLPLLMENFWGQPVHVRFNVTFAMRTSRAGEEGFVKDLQRAVWEVDSTLPVTQVRTLADVYERSLARTSFTLVMLAIAGGMALFIGVVGIYGVIAYAITQRVREIGIRVALGAEAAALTRMFVGQGVALAATGVACGVVVALGVTRVMSSLLFGIGPLDPVTYGSVAAALIACAAAASYAPASRAAAVNPVEALRAE